MSKWVEASEKENGGGRNGNVEKEETLMHLPAQLENTRSLAPGNDLLRLITSFKDSQSRFSLDFTYPSAAYTFFLNNFVFFRSSSVPKASSTTLTKCHNKIVHNFL